MDFSFLGPVEVDLVLQALQDGRVRRALAQAIFDAKVRRAWRRLRVSGMKVSEVEEVLAERYACSTETIRTIVYRKRERQRSARRLKG